MQDEGIPHARSLPMYVCHAIAIVGPFVVRFSWRYVALAAGLYVVRMIALSAGYHRYFSHRAYRTSRAFQFVLAFVGGTCAQRGALWWAANHRHHHAHSDSPEDVHSPRRQGFLWSHLGWILSKRFERTQEDRIKDFARFPELRWLDEHHFMPSWALFWTLWAVAGWPAVIWGSFTSTVFMWHCTFSINSVAHRFGRQRYVTDDDSRNNAPLALLTMGEGWHNNHHHYRASAALGFYWWELDFTYYVLRLLAAVGLIWDLRTPPRAVRDRWAAEAAS
ncbi:MAG TPA: acyl-CoA desaturase [Polyangia bacterium]|nr:acyl-CoA desaturase [Polyangia bacterium]